jgi:predicted DNA-binding transcriptional regulator AlpA
MWVIYSKNYQRKLALIVQTSETPSQQPQTRSRELKTTDLLITEDIAAMCHVTPSTVRYWRATNQGPKSFRLGGKRVLYRPDDVQEWIENSYRQANPEARTA